ncbi:MAG: leucine-rich repeat domain-containing protein [Bacteroidales bacterium]|nr:leucine-rich repeat domain-containing protein [Bacteroidales bacterium]
MNRLTFLFLLLLSVLPLALQSQPDRVYTKLSEIKHPEQVYQLKLRYKRLHRVPDVVWQCSNLRSLDLSHNLIDTLSPQIAQLSQLEELHMGRNRLRALPAELGGLKRLRVLNLSRNPLLDLPAELGSLSSLERLVIWSTGVISLPPSFVALDGTLKEVDMRVCPMTYDDQVAIDELLPSVRKRWDHVCNCK